MTVHRRAIEKAQHPTHLVIQLLGGKHPFTYQFLVVGGQVVVVVGIRGTERQAVGPCAKLHIQAIHHRLTGIMTTTPVGNHHTIILPILFQDLIQQDIIMTVVLILVEVVRPHQAPGTTLADSSLEGRQVDLMQCPVGNDHVYLMPVFLIVVQRIVLDTGSNTLRLQTLYVGHHHTRDEEGVFTHIFKVPAAEWCTVDVHPRAEDHILATIERFLAEILTIESCHRRIPCGSQTGECREGNTRVVGLPGLLPLIP